MATRIINSTVNEVDAYAPHNYVGYCLEDPLEVIKELSKTHWILGYKGYDHPFSSYSGGTNQSGGLFIDEVGKEIRSNEVKPPAGTKIVLILEELIKTGVLDEDKRKKNLSKKDLKEAFLERIKQFSCLKSPYAKAITLSYWRDLDNELIHNIEHELFRAGVPTGRLIFGKYFENVDKRRYSMGPILIEMRKEFPEFTPEIEKAAYDQVAKNANFSIPIELLKLFEMPNTTYEDIKKMIKPKEIDPWVQRR